MTTTNTTVEVGDLAMYAADGVNLIGEVVAVPTATAPHYVLVDDDGVKRNALTVTWVEGLPAGTAAV